MKLTHGYPFWLINDGLPYHYKKLVQNISTDVTIIGGGISGALTAYCLTNAGIACILVDGRTIGLGSTCASTSLLQYELDTPLHKLTEQIGRQKAESAYQLCGEAIDKIKYIAKKIGYKEYEERKSLFFSTHSGERKFIEKEFAARKNAGFELSLLNEKELQETFGIKAKYGLLSKRGATINAYSLTHQLLQHSINKGLKVFDRTCVTDIKYNTTGSELSTKEGFKINSKYIVNASGFEVVNFISKKIVEFYCTYAIVSEHQSEQDSLWKDSILLWNTDDPYLYIRLTKDNRLLVGGRDERFSNSITRETFLEKKARLLEKDFERIYPLIDFKTEFAWCGTFGKTKDALPFIGAYPETPNTFYALGFGGNGITFSMLAAEIITALIQGKKHEDAALFSFNR
jgi:glycine/D-amino acid oxidase-like deaminating enzyme